MKQLGTHPSFLDSKKLETGSTTLMNAKSTLYLLEYKKLYPYTIVFEGLNKTKIPDMFKRSTTIKRKKSEEEEEEKNDTSKRLKIHKEPEGSKISANENGAVSNKAESMDMSESDSDDDVTSRLRAMKDTLNKVEKNVKKDSKNVLKDSLSKPKPSNSGLFFLFSFR